MSLFHPSTNWGTKTPYICWLRSWISVNLILPPKKDPHILNNFRERARYFKFLKTTLEFNSSQLAAKVEPCLQLANWRSGIFGINHNWRREKREQATNCHFYKYRTLQMSGDIEHLLALISNFKIPLFLSFILKHSNIQTLKLTGFISTYRLQVFISALFPLRLRFSFLFSFFLYFFSIICWSLNHQHPLWHPSVQELLVRRFGFANCYKLEILVVH